MSALIEDPAAVLAAIRATGGLPLERADSQAIAVAKRRAESAGRVLLNCNTGSAHQRASGRGLVLGWNAQSTPAPEDSQAYPVRNLYPVAILTWACCLGLAWPDRVAPPYPGLPFTRSDVLDVTGELGVSAVWVKSALLRTLVPARLVMTEGASLCLGPAAAALPEAFVEAMRRFHDRLPRFDVPASRRDTYLDEAEVDESQFDEDEDVAVTHVDAFDDDDFGEMPFVDPLDG